MLERILLIGFEPFASHARNVSGEAVSRLEGSELEGFELHTLVLPTDLGRALPLLEEALDGGPAAILVTDACEGDDEPGEVLRIEVAARNDRGDGTPLGDGPAMSFSTLPVAAIKRGLEEAGFAAELCEDSGQNHGNAVFYTCTRRPVPAGFLHLPLVASAEAGARALEAGLRATAQRLLAQRVEAAAG